MIGAIIGDLAAWTYENDRETFRTFETLFGKWFPYDDMSWIYEY